MGFWIAAGAVILLMAVPLGVRGLYDGVGAFAYLLIGPGRILLYPRNKTENKPRKPAPEKKQPAASGAPKNNKTGGSYKDFLPLVDVVLDFLGDLRRKLRVNRLELNVIMAGEDPADLAQNYGRAWASAGNLMPLLERVFVIKQRSVQVQCDFTAETSSVYADIVVTITLGRLLWLVIRYSFRGLKEYFKIKNTNKGGAKL